MINLKNKEKYIIPEDAYNWTMVTIREVWRRHRSDLKMTYYDPYDNDEVRMAKRLGHIPECQEKDKETVSSKDLFVVTRTRKPERLYKASNENTTSKIAEMEEIEKQMSVNGEYVDAFSSVMGPQHPRRLRLYGVGVTKTTLTKKNWQFGINFKCNN
ncbi:hypothetical protein KY289_008162 [Solanum tuberosum]|nr:hypothetical protein KY289_008162 [Solanum tuberosum]